MTTLSPSYRAATLAVSVLPFLLLACGKGNPKSAAPPSMPVVVGAVTREDVPVEWRGVGAIEAISAVAVKSQVGGELVGVHFQEGQDVKQGDLLFTIDERPFTAALRTAQAQLERDRALAQSAQSEAKRYEELVSKEFVTRSQTDEKSAQAVSSQATVRADEAQLERAKLDLQYCRILAPLSGRTGSVALKQGNVVKANDDKPLVVIQQMAPIRAAFSLPQQFLGQVLARSKASTLMASVKAPEDPGPPHTGALVFIDNAVDASSGTIAVKAEFANQDRQLWPGQFVNVNLVLDTDQGVVVAPSQAIQGGQNGDYVFVVKEDQTVEMRPVTVRRAAGDKTVIDKGLEPGERVVVEGQLRLQPGAHVEVQTPKAPAG
ncbi:MAG: efflux RND transporter periplasmic adaptor subunit [Acidobacteriota bacterium]